MTSTDRTAAPLPATRPAVPEGDVELHAATTMPSFGRDLVRTLHEARSAVSALALTDSLVSDVEVSAYTALVCTGNTPAAALAAAAALATKAPSLEIHALSWARVPGPREGTTEFQVTITVTSPDPETGEHGGSTHHADRRRG
ncbi:hypothetical protein ACWGE1_09405 [Streptomyces sp. NPDC054932]